MFVCLFINKTLLYLRHLKIILNNIKLNDIIN